MIFKKILVFSILILFFLSISSITSSACEFYFDYQEINAPLALTGTIGVRVLKTHNNCSIESMNEYLLQWDKIQVIDETQWKEISNNLFEKELRIVLSEIGEGYFSISKDCTREGYDEKRLPITINPGQDIWNTAFNEKYPYDIEMEVNSLKGSFSLKENTLIIDNESILLKEIPEKLLNYDQQIVVYFTQKEDIKTALLIVSETLFYRF